MANSQYLGSQKKKIRELKEDIHDTLNMGTLVEMDFLRQGSLKKKMQGLKTTKKQLESQEEELL